MSRTEPTVGREEERRVEKEEMRTLESRLKELEKESESVSVTHGEDADAGIEIFPRLSEPMSLM